ncbi:MAG: hypothetical protein OK404_02815 [Thaumarchaeota archaeon]|nr:hypothetical protein [Nitrososphaerota archaeon]
MKVIRLTPLVQLLVPSLLVSTLSRSTRGISFYPGRWGFALGAFLVGASLTIGLLLGGPYRLVGATLAYWLLGTVGTLMMVSVLKPLALIKPICVQCRLLPIIKEHESIHLTGVTGEAKVWAAMKTRHTTDSLHLDGDPAICWFCPIPKRLAAK